MDFNKSFLDKASVLPELYVLQAPLSLKVTIIIFPAYISKMAFDCGVEIFLKCKGTSKLTPQGTQTTLSSWSRVPPSLVSCSNVLRGFEGGKTTQYSKALGEVLSPGEAGFLGSVKWRREQIHKPVRTEMSRVSGTCKGENIFADI